MLRRPTFKPHYRAQVVPGEGLFLLSEAHQTVLQGRLYEVIAPWLDGRTVEEVCACLGDQLSPAQVFYTLKQLEQKGFLAEFNETLPSGHAALWEMQNLNRATAAERLAETAVAVTALGSLSAEPFEEMLRSLRVQTGSRGELGVVLAEQYLARELQAYNQAALLKGQSWLLIKPVGCQVWFGPLFRPGRTGCWECLAQRLRANFPIVGYLDGRQDFDGAPLTDVSRTSATLSAVWGLAATAVASWIARGESPLLEGKIQSLDVSTWEVRSHELLRLPSCPACGNGQKSADGPVQPVILQSRQKTFTQDGGHRTARPEETIQKYERFVSPICGAVSMLEKSNSYRNHSHSDDSHSNEVVHVYFSGKNIARGARNWANLKGDLRSGSCGKGTSDAQARASALCEGLERYSGFFWGDEPRRRARMSDLGDAAIHPNDCMRFSDRQFQDRDAWNERYAFYNYIPTPFDPEAEVDWTPVWSLTHGAVRYLPTAFCYFSYPAPSGAETCVGCSNGNAAGNTLEEAVLQGLLELIERDSVALWWYNRVQVPAVDLDSFNEPYISRLREHLRNHGRNLWVLDLSADLGIPVFAALSRRTEGAIEQIMFGFGAHLDARIALLRAVTELNQMLVHLLHAPADDPSISLSDRETLHWLRTGTLADNPYLVPHEGAARTASSYSKLWTNDLKDDVRVCQERVERLGLELLVLNQTRSEIGLPTVKVIVPGLRHFWARFAPGRLYDIPVQLGWLAQPTQEEDLNPVHMFL